MQHAFREPRNQGLGDQLCKLQRVACYDSWYRSCVELIVPSLLHMRAVKTLDSIRFAASGKFWFGWLDVILNAGITAVADGE